MGDLGFQWESVEGSVGFFCMLTGMSSLPPSWNSQETPSEGGWWQLYFLFLFLFYFGIINIKVHEQHCAY